MAKKYILIMLFISLFSLNISTIAHAITIKNKCKFTIAGSISDVDTGVILAQFRINPKSKYHFTKSLTRSHLQIRIIKDGKFNGRNHLLKLNIDNPAVYIELKCRRKKITYTIE